MFRPSILRMSERAKEERCQMKWSSETTKHPDKRQEKTLKEFS